MLFKRLLGYVKPYRAPFVFSVGFLFILAFLSPLRVLLMQYMIDHYVRTPDPVSLLHCTLLLIGLLVLEGLLQFAGSYISARVGQHVIRDIRIGLFSHISNLRIRYFDTTAIGTLVTRVVSDIETIGDMFSEGLIEITGDLLKLIVVIVTMFYFNVSISLMILTTIPVLLFATYLFKNAVKSAFQDVRTQVARLNAFVQEHITGMSIVQIFNREDREYEKFRQINMLHRDANIRSIWYYSVFFPVVEILSSVALGLLVWYGGRKVLMHSASPGDLVAFILLINMLFRPIRMLADRFNTLQMGMVSAERVFKLMDANEQVPDSGKLQVRRLNGEIEFRDVWFSYAKEPVPNWVLKGVSFQVKKGETIAIVGATGAGKTSIVSLLNRFYEYDKGEILFDGNEIASYSLNTLRKNVGLVQQDVFLFSDTIANNISLHDPSISREQIIESAKSIGVHDFIMKLPGGYDYNVMERGGMLSVGQRQLIAFIRAYVYDPAILILDEATSSIDTESELLLQAATERLIKSRTSIVIAHRLATIKNATRILVLDQGKVVETGSHQQLLQLGGIYSGLYELQFKTD